MNKFNVGDKVIVTKYEYGTKPQVSTVSKVTPSGKFIYVDGFKSRFKVSDWKDEAEQPGESWRSSNFRTTHFSQEKFDELESEYNQIIKERQEKAKEQQDRREEMERKRLQEIEDLKSVFDFEKFKSSKVVFPDGTRMYQGFVPVKESQKERKKGFEYVIVRLGDEEGYDFSDNKQKTQIALYVTYVNGNNQSFPSCSGSYFDDEESALWEAVRYCHHNW